LLTISVIRMRWKTKIWSSSILVATQHDWPFRTFWSAGRNDLKNRREGDLPTPNRTGRQSVDLGQSEFLWSAFSGGARWAVWFRILRREWKWRDVSVDSEYQGRIDDNG
jgi:hypothetical protein